MVRRLCDCPRVCEEDQKRRSAEGEEGEVRVCRALWAVVRNVALMLRQEPLEGF